VGRHPACARGGRALLDPKYHGDWDFTAEAGEFRHDGVAAIVFGVVPTKVLAFAKGRSAQTGYRFASRPQAQPRSQSQMPTPANQKAIR
jgi:hypothetical protein